VSAEFKRSVQVVVEHDDLAELLTGQLCNFATPFRHLEVSLIEKQSDGSWKLRLDRKQKVAAIGKKAAA
jgi:transcription antitermination factor NusA-like protein